MTTLHTSTCTPRGRHGPLEMDSHIHDNTIHKYMYTSWQIRSTRDGLSHPRHHYIQVHVHLVADTVHSRWTLTSTTSLYTSTCTPRGRYGPLEMDSHIHDITIYKYMYTSWQIRSTRDGLSHPRHHYIQVHVHLVADTVHLRWTLTSTTTPYTSTCILRGRYGPLEMDSHIHDNNTIHKYMYTSWQIRSIRDGLSHPRQHHTQVHVYFMADTVHSRWTLTSTTTPYTSTCILHGRYGPLEMDSRIHDNTIHKYMYTT